jgi:hypothetical protein
LTTTVSAPVVSAQIAGVQETTHARLIEDEGAVRALRLRRHHIYIQPGIFRTRDEDIELGGLGFTIGGGAFFGALGYRYSLSPRFDICFEIRHWIGAWSTPTSQEVELAAGFIGPGIRLNASRSAHKRVVPYFQGNLFYVQEQLGDSPRRSRAADVDTQIGHGLAFGLSGGLDFELIRFLSVATEVLYVRTVSADIDDLSGIGASVGVAFSF